MRTIAVGWEYEVPIEEVDAAREAQRAELQAFYQSAPESLTDEDVARFLVRTAHPTSRYLRPDVTGLGYHMQSA